MPNIDKPETTTPKNLQRELTREEFMSLLETEKGFEVLLKMFFRQEYSELLEQPPSYDMIAEFAKIFKEATGIDVDIKQMHERFLRRK